MIDINKVCRKPSYACVQLDLDLEKQCHGTYLSVLSIKELLKGGNSCKGWKSSTALAHEHIPHNQNHKDAKLRASYPSRPPLDSYP